MREARRESNRLVESRNEANAQYLQAALEHSRHLSTMRTVHKAWLEASVRLIEASSDVHGLQRRASAIVQQRDAEEKKLEEAAAAHSRYHKAASELRTEIGELRARFGDEFTRIAGDRTPEEVRHQLAADEEQLGMISAVQPGTLERYEEVVAAIAKLERQMEKSREKMGEVTGDIEELRARWEPKVDELVAKVTEAFSYNFEKIGCAGEVRLHKDEDFEKWALHVMVSYR